MKNDLQHLKWLSIAHYFLAGFIAWGICFSLFHLFVGLGLRLGVLDVGRTDISFQKAGYLFGYQIIELLIKLGLILLISLAGWKIGQHRSRNYCLVTACLQGLSVPVALGTIILFIGIIYDFSALVHDFPALLVVAAVFLSSPSFFVLGTILGIFTIIVLMRPSVRSIFEEQEDHFIPKHSTESTC